MKDRKRVDIDWRGGGKNLEENFEEVENIWYIVLIKNLLSIQINFLKRKENQEKMKRQYDI